MEEIQTKLGRVRALMDQRKLDAVWLRRVENVVWITAGIDVAVNLTAAAGIASVVITPDKAIMLTNTIEAPRLRTEDRVEELGFELHVSPWESQEETPKSAALGVDLPQVGAVDMTWELTLIRQRLLSPEQDRFRDLSISCAEAMHRAINRVTPGSAEIELAAAVDYELRIRNVTPIVVLVAVDERIHQVRHPIPTKKLLEKYAMLVLCGRRYGLVCSVTRLVHFGPLSDELRRRMEANAQVDAAMLAASQPGATLGEVLRVAQDTYAQTGYPNEWKLHHQGGTAGYTAREVVAAPGQDSRLEAGMVCAWNPSITGVKMEDSIMVPPPGQSPEVLTRMYGWPTRTIEINGMKIERPLIMELN
jgi:antitoxin VapB